MTTETSPGRQITLVPMPPGLWPVIAGVVLAALGPLFGFLVGSMIGTDEGDDLDPLYLALFAGFVVGAAGVGLVLLGARRLYRDRAAWAGEHPDDRADDQPEDQPDRRADEQVDP